MVKVSDVLNKLCELAPLGLKMDFDNVGLLVGWPENEVKTVLCTLDVTADTVREAVEVGADLIVAHHPVFFQLKAVRADEPIGADVLSMVKNGISEISMHTNLDIARGGVNDALASRLGLENIDVLAVTGTDSEGDYGLGRVGTVGECSLCEFLSDVKNKLNANGLRYADAGRPVRKVAVVGGSGSSELMAAVSSGCDTLITADVKYNGFLDAKTYGINLIDAGHFPTENVVVEPLAEYIRANFPALNVKVSEIHRQPEEFYM